MLPICLQMCVFSFYRVLSFSFFFFFWEREGGRGVKVVKLVSFICFLGPMNSIDNLDLGD